MNWSAVFAVSKRFFRRNVKSKRFIIFMAMPLVAPILAMVAVLVIWYFSSRNVVIVCPKELETVAIQIKDALSQGEASEQIDAFQASITLTTDDEDLRDIENILKTQVKNAKIIGYVIVRNDEEALQVKVYPSSSIHDGVRALKERVLTVAPLLRKEDYQSDLKFKMRTELESLRHIEEKLSQENLRLAGGQFLVVIGIICLSMLDATIFQAVIRERVLSCLETLMSVITPRELCFGLCLGNMLVFLVAFSWYMLLVCTVLLAIGAISLNYIFGVTLFALSGCMLSCAFSCNDALRYGNIENPKQMVGIYMPVKFLLVMGCFQSLFTPNSILARILGILPLTSPYVAPFRFEYGDNSSVIEYMLSLLILIASTWIVLKFRIGRIQTEQTIYPPPRKKRR